MDAIRTAIAPRRVFIDHVGSTAVPGLASKPVVDLLISLVEWDDADNVVRVLEAVGYIQKENHEAPPRRFLQKNLDGKGTLEEVHLHLAPVDSPWGRDMLVFRDELIADAELAERYESLKRESAQDNPDDPSAYTAQKSEFVKRVLREAAGAFGNDRLLTHQRAELDRAQFLQNLALAAQFSVAVVAAVSVYSDNNTTQLNFALLGFVLAALWFYIAHKQRSHRSIGDQARRVVLLASGLGAQFSAEQRLRIFDKFTVPLLGIKLVRDEAYFASRSAPGYRRLAELIEESAYWTRDLQKASATALGWGLLVVAALMGIALWLGIPVLSQDDGISLARVLITLLVFLLTSDLVGALLAHWEASNKIGEILQRAETAAARGYPESDVLLLMSDYNATVEKAPFILPGIFKLRQSGLTRRWRAYLENKRR